MKDINHVGLVVEGVEDVRQVVSEVGEVVEQVGGRCWRSSSSREMRNGRVQQKTTSQMTTFLLTFLVCVSPPG